jgi:hypothetical protein
MIKVLRSQVATLVVLTLALLAQLPHAAEVFKEAGHASGVMGWLHSYSYAIALELAVLLFVVQGRRRESYGFAFVSVLVNLAYYAERGPLFSMDALPAWLISLALSIAIALYSHSLAHEEKEGVQVAAEDAQPSRDAVQEVQEVDASAEDAVQGDWVGYAMQLRKAGRTFKEIASEVDKHESTVSRRLNGVHA